MKASEEPPIAHRSFVERYPKLGRAWALSVEAGEEGPLDAKTVRLVKLAIAMGALREGAVHANVRKAVAAGITTEEIEQVVALGAGTLGFPSAVALFCWTRDVIGKPGGEP